MWSVPAVRERGSTTVSHTRIRRLTCSWEHSWPGVRNSSRQRLCEAPAMFEFLNPLYFVGLLAAGIPLLVHLSRSKKTKKMRFSTTRFFTDQFLRSYRMSRLKELLLLVCRMALFALFALALTQP